MIFDYVSRSNALPFTQQVVTRFTSELQWSPDFQVGIVLSGEISVHYHMHTRDFGLHELLFFLPMETFSVVDAGKDARVLFVTVDRGFISQLCPHLSHLRLSQNHLHANLTNPVYVSLVTDFSTLIFNNLKRELCTRMKLLNAATHIVSTIFEQFGLVGNQAPSETVLDRRADILQYISAHYTEKIAVSDIAGHLGLHPQYFSAYFRKQFSTTFVEYLTGYRINRSIYDLVYTDHSILDIALDHGFNSHKTYAMAFKKLYGCTPMDYRHDNHHSDNDTPPDLMDTDGGGEDAFLFVFFRQFLEQDRQQLQHAQYPVHSRKTQTVSFQTDQLIKEEKSYEGLRMVSAGRAFTCLRSEVQKQIRLAKEDLDFTYLRIRDIFSDDLFVYYEDETKKAHYNWSSLDNVFDFILSIGCIPFPEIGYMPNMLAAKRQYAGVSYHPNVSIPKSMSAWKELIQSFLLHFIERYGMSELDKWYFDFWTSPDLQIKNAYWNESQEMFFAFYQATYEAFQSISPTLRLGSANFSTITGYSWYEAFFQYCYGHHIYPAYVCFHSYGSRAMENEGLTDTFLRIHQNQFSISDQDYIVKSLKTIHQIMNRSGFRSLDVIVSDWNLSFIPRDLLRDTCYMGPYMAHVMLETAGLAKGMCFWTLSDIHEDAYPDSALFPGGPGMLDYHSIKKASYNVLALLSQLGNTILAKGENYIFTRKGARYQLLFYNLPELDEGGSSLDVTAIDETHRYHIYNSEDISLNGLIDLPPGTYYVKRSEVNRNFGSGYDLWNRMGAPEVLHKELEDYLRLNSVPHVTFSVENVEKTLVLEEEVPAHGVLLIELIPKR